MLDDESELVGFARVSSDDAMRCAGFERTSIQLSVERVAAYRCPPQHRHEEELQPLVVDGWDHVADRPALSIKNALAPSTAAFEKAPGILVPDAKPTLTRYAHDAIVDAGGHHAQVVIALVGDNARQPASRMTV